MVEPNELREEEFLAERLRQEAKASRPEFSERLHGRLCRAVQECDVRHVAALRRRMAPLWVGRRAVAAAAAVVLLATAVVFGPSTGRHRPTQPPHENGAEPVTAIDPSAGMGRVSDLASQATENLDILMDSAIEAQRWAQLDHDAQVVIQTLADRLPFDVPTTLAFSETPDQLQ
jgi:hypothetical protein